MTGISRETYELVMLWQSIVVRIAAPQRNGLPLPPRWTRALTELRGAVDGTKVDASTPPRAPCEEIDVATAATRLGIAPRAVRKRIASGTLHARRVGRMWLVETEEPGGTGKQLRAS